MFQEQVTEIRSRLCGLSFICFEVAGIPNYREPNTVLFIIYTHSLDVTFAKCNLKFGIPATFLMVSNLKCDSN